MYAAVVSLTVSLPLSSSLLVLMLAVDCAADFGNTCCVTHYILEMIYFVSSGTLNINSIKHQSLSRMFVWSISAVSLAGPPAVLHHD